MNILMHQPHRMRTLTSIIVCCLLTGAAAHADQLPDQAPEGKVYAYKAENGKRGEIEIHFPAGHDPAKARVPGIIMFHGGGWKGGNREQFRDMCHYFASRGLVAATAHYRFADRDAMKDRQANPSPKRVCITDAKSAIRWFKQHADELGIDPERIIAGGGSAGGHISLLATNNPGLNDPADPPHIDTSVVAYLLFNPAFKPAADRNDPAVDVEQHLSTETAPMIAFWGTDDNWLNGWNQAYQKMQSQGIDASVEWWVAEGAGHGFFNNEPWKSLTYIEADRFLVEQGLLAGAPTISAPTKDQALVKSPRPPTK